MPYLPPPPSLPSSAPILRPLPPPFHRHVVHRTPAALVALALPSFCLGAPRAASTSPALPPLFRLPSTSGHAFALPSVHPSILPYPLPSALCPALHPHPRPTLAPYSRSPLRHSCALKRRSLPFPPSPSRPTPALPCAPPSFSRPPSVPLLLPPLSLFRFATPRSDAPPLRPSFSRCPPPFRPSSTSPPPAPRALSVHATPAFPLPPSSAATSSSFRPSDPGPCVLRSALPFLPLLSSTSRSTPSYLTPPSLLRFATTLPSPPSLPRAPHSSLASPRPHSTPLLACLAMRLPAMRVQFSRRPFLRSLSSTSPEPEPSSPAFLPFRPPHPAPRRNGFALPSWSRRLPSPSPFPLSISSFLLSPSTSPPFPPLPSLVLTPLFRRALFSQKQDEPKWIPRTQRGDGRERAPGWVFEGDWGGDGVGGWGGVRLDCWREEAEERRGRAGAT
ncbi:hypothetical protein C8R45DRAFT_1174304 [Mycena sanguinolenta]|nr:hypothetical protein C8R45DRAFT_1174304 [Mycena sanguinolenta]